MHSRMTWVEWMSGNGWEDCLDAMPMLPTLAHEVLEFAMDPDVATTRITQVVSKDPVLATRVLQLANSAFSGSATEITSIGQAVVRMGTTAVRNVVTATCLSSMLADRRVYGNHGRELLDHGIGTAYVAWLLADAAGEPPDEAFVCGLLHDIGKLLIQKLARDPNAGVMRPDADELDAFITERHAEFGGHLLKWWRLPTRLMEPIVCHHTPELAASRPTAAALAYAANRLSHRYGFGCAREDEDLLADPMFAKIGVDAVALKRIDERAPGLYDVARKITR